MNHLSKPSSFASLEAAAAASAASSAAVPDIAPAATAAPMPAPGRRGPAPDLAAFADTLRLRGLAASTREEYLRHLAKLAAHAGARPETLDETAVLAFLLHLHGPARAARASLRSAYAALRLFYRQHLGRDWRLMAVARAPRECPLPRTLSRAQVGRLLAVVPEPRFRVLLRLIYVCGLRLGEALGLEVTDIDREGPYVWVRHGKGNRARRVPLPQAMLEELRAWWRTHRHPRWLFPSRRRRPGQAAMKPGTVQTRLRRARRAANLPEKTTPHTLRHCYATHLLEAGVCIRVISACLGHSSLQITLRYASITQPSEATARLAAADLIGDMNDPAESEEGNR